MKRKPTRGIACTLSAKMLESHPNGYKGLIDKFGECDGLNKIFNWRMSAIPTQEPKPVFIYFVIGNKIRWTAMIATFEKGDTRTFDDGRIITSRAWAILYDFQKMPKPYIEMRGFQGFRYFDI